MVNFRPALAGLRISRPTRSDPLSRRTHAGHLSIFEGLPAEELARLLATLETRVYPAGATVIAEGDRTNEVFIAQSGSAEVVIAAEDGTDHPVGHVVPGGTIGEIALLTGQPAVATVRAVDDFEAVVLTRGGRCGARRQVPADLSQPGNDPGRAACAHGSPRDRQA